MSTDLTLLPGRLCRERAPSTRARLPATGRPGSFVMLHQRTGISCELQSLSGDALREHKALFDANFPTAVTYPDAAPTGKASCWVETPAAGDGEEGEDGNQGFLIMWNANGYGENMAVYITLVRPLPEWPEGS